MKPDWTSPDGTIRLWNRDCLDVLPTLEAGSIDAVVTDPPYGMGKGEWDEEIPVWLPLIGTIPTAAFCGVVGLRDYPTPDWIGAWVRLGSVQRNGRLRGFSNWEPIVFYNVTSLDNDVISCPNLHDDTGHPTTKPTPLMVRLIEKMPDGTVLDPFMGSGTTGIACIRLGRKFLGIEREPKYFDIAVRRIEAELRQPRLFPAAAPVETQTELFGESA